MGLRNTWEQVCRKAFRHWIVAASLTIGGAVLGHAISQSNLWVGVRYAVYQRVMDATHIHGRLYPKRTAIVFIGDDQYWTGDLGGRSPIKRDYIARLIDKIAAADPAAIAIDFDLRS